MIEYPVIKLKVANLIIPHISEFSSPFKEKLFKLD